MIKYTKAKQISPACAKLIESFLTAQCTVIQRPGIISFKLADAQLDCYIADADYCISIGNESLTLCKEDDEATELGKFFLQYIKHADLLKLITENAPELGKAQLC